MNKTPVYEALGAAVRGVFCGFDESGEPVVDFQANEGHNPVVAMTTTALVEKDKGREVVLLFEDGDPKRPIIVGVLQPSPTKGAENDTAVRPPAVEIDGERLIYTAGQEIVLRCGKASIQLLSDGTVRIKGSNVLSRASATNRIRGGNVQIN
jgi:hypothetical protein